MPDTPASFITGVHGEGNLTNETPTADRSLLFEVGSVYIQETGETSTENLILLTYAAPTQWCFCNSLCKHSKYSRQ